MNEAPDADENNNANPSGLAFSLCIFGRPCGIRTCDQRIKSPLLYQLS